MTILSYDWYGFANAMSMASSVLIRYWMVKSIRESIDKEVQKAHDDAAAHGKGPERLGGGPPCKVLQKILIITNDAKAVTMLIPAEFMAPPSPFIANLKPQYPDLYTTMRFCGWISFAVQVVTIGMSDLATQLVTVFLLVVPTILFIKKLGCDDSHLASKIGGLVQREKVPTGIPTSRVKKPTDVEGAKGSVQSATDNSNFEPKYSCWIGRYLKAEVCEWPLSHHYTIEEGQFKQVQDPHKKDNRSEKRQHLYAWLQLTVKETESMDKWDLFPHKRGEDENTWFKGYEAGKTGIEKLTSAGKTGGIRKFIPWTKQDEEDDRGRNGTAAEAVQDISVSPTSANQDSTPPSYPTAHDAITGSRQQPTRSATSRSDAVDSIVTVPPSSAMFVSQETRARRPSIAPTSAHVGMLAATVSPHTRPAASVVPVNDGVIDSRPSTATSQSMGQHPGSGDVFRRPAAGLQDEAGGT